MKLIISKQEPIVMSCENKTKSKFARVPVLGIIGVAFLASLVIAGVLYLATSKTDYTLTAPITVLDTLPDSVQAAAGDYYTYSLNISNEANQEQNYSVEYWLNSSEVTLASGDAKVRILGNDNSTVIAESSTVESGVIKANYNNIPIRNDMSVLLYLTVEFHPSAVTGVYNLNYRIRPGDHSFNG